MGDETNLELDVDFDRIQQIARVMVADACGYTRKGAPTITIDCATPQAFEREIKRLKGELDAISGRAEEVFGAGSKKGATAKKKTKSDPDTEKRGIKPRLDSQLSVADVMTREVKTVRRNDRLSVAEELMKVGRFRHVVVLDDGDRVAGVVSHRDLVYGAIAWTLGQGRAAHDKALEAYPVKDVMAVTVATIDSAAPLRDAAALMAERKLGCLPVVDGDELVGILTEGDFLFLLSGE